MERKRPAYRDARTFPSPKRANAKPEGSTSALRDSSLIGFSPVPFSVRPAPVRSLGSATPPSSILTCSNGTTATTKGARAAKSSRDRPGWLLFRDGARTASSQPRSAPAPTGHWPPSRSGRSGHRLLQRPYPQGAGGALARPSSVGRASVLARHGERQHPWLRARQRRAGGRIVELDVGFAEGPAFFASGRNPMIAARVEKGLNSPPPDFPVPLMGRIADVARPRQAGSTGSSRRQARRSGRPRRLGRPGSTASLFGGQLLCLGGDDGGEGLRAGLILMCGICVACRECETFSTCTLTSRDKMRMSARRPRLAGRCPHGRQQPAHVRREALVRGLDLGGGEAAVRTKAGQATRQTTRRDCSDRLGSERLRISQPGARSRRLGDSRRRQRRLSIGLAHGLLRRGDVGPALKERGRQPDRDRGNTSGQATAGIDRPAGGRPIRTRGDRMFALRARHPGGDERRLEPSGALSWAVITSDLAASPGIVLVLRDR